MQMLTHIQARDVVETIEMYELDAMFVFTVTMGVVMLLMSWIVVVLAVKGWAVRRELRGLAYEMLPSEEQDEA
jgi:ABC-type nickel/cobalt efflux system permease component RcnA